MDSQSLIEVMKNTLNLYTIYLLKNHHYFIKKLIVLKSNKKSIELNTAYAYL